MKLNKLYGFAVHVGDVFCLGNAVIDVPVTRKGLVKKKRKMKSKEKVKRDKRPRRNNNLCNTIVPS
jgi:hypothetical protein